MPKGDHKFGVVFWTESRQAHTLRGCSWDAAACTPNTTLKGARASGFAQREKKIVVKEGTVSISDLATLVQGRAGREVTVLIEKHQNVFRFSRESLRACTRNTTPRIPQGEHQWKRREVWALNCVSQSRKSNTLESFFEIAIFENDSWIFPT